MAPEDHKLNGWDSEPVIWTVPSPPPPKNKYLSRKFILAVAGAVVIILNELLEANGLRTMDPDTVLAFVGLLASYVLGEAWVDSRK